MRTAAAMAPRKAAGVIQKRYAGQTMRTTMPARPAPDEMPMICGSARGLRMTAWRIAPDKARFAPTRAPVRVRGRRIFQII